MSFPPHVQGQLTPAGAARGVTLSHGYRALQPLELVKSHTKSAREVKGFNESAFS